MSDKVWRLFYFGSDFLHLNVGNGTMPLNPLPKLPPYDVYVCLFVNLATSSWGVSKLWVGGAPTLDSDPSAPRIRSDCYT